MTRSCTGGDAEAADDGEDTERPALGMVALAPGLGEGASGLVSGSFHGITSKVMGE